MDAEQHRVAGNDAFRRRDYAAAIEHYTAAIDQLTALPYAETGGQPANPALRLTLLINRSTAHYQAGSYAFSSQDAQAVLSEYPENLKAMYRAAVALLQQGHAAAVVRLMDALQQAGDGRPGQPLPPGWEAFKAHAQARLAHEERKGRQGAGNAAARAVAILADLEAEADGEGEGDPQLLISQLAGLLESQHPDEGSDAAAALEASGSQAFQLLLFHLAGPDAACSQRAGAALKAAAVASGGASAAVLWPPLVWQRLTALAAESSGSGSAAALRLLGWAAGRDAWVRQHLLTHPLPGGGAGSSPLQQILAVLHDASKLQHAAPESVELAAALLLHCSRDVGSLEALNGFRPLLALLRAAAAAEGMSSFRVAGQETLDAGAEQEPDSGLARGAGVASILAAAPATEEEAEERALQALRLKRQQVFVAELVRLQRCLLRAACALADASRELVAAEAVHRRHASGGKWMLSAGAFSTELLDLVKRLHGQQPRRTAPELDAQGQPRAYVKRRFAADYKDNPVGDYLATMDLKDGGGLQAGQQGAAAQQADSTLLELSLALLLRVAEAGARPASLLYRKSVFTLCEELCAYLTPSVVAAAQRLYAAVADSVPAAAEELLQGAAVPACVGIFLHSSTEQHRLKALDRLAALADTCTGDEFALLTAAQGGAVHQAWQLASAAGQRSGEEQQDAASSQALARHARQLVLLCCDRAQRQQQLVRGTPPRGGAWAAIGRRALGALLREERQQGGAFTKPVRGAEADTSFVHLKKGFFGRPAAAKKAAKPAAQQVETKHSGTQPFSAECLLRQPLAPSSGGGGDGSSSAPTPVGSVPQPASHTYKGGAVTIREIPEAGAAPSAPLSAPTFSPAASPAPTEPAEAAQPAASAAARPCQPPAPASRPPLVLPHGAAEQQLLDAHATAQQAQAEADAEELPELRDVYDSAATLDAGQRRARQAWVGLPLDRKLRWKQTAGEVSVVLAVPAGTRKDEVTATAGHLNLGLRWFGRVAGGQLHRRVKLADVHWYLEGSEVHIQLGKAEHGSNWRGLFHGNMVNSLAFNDPEFKAMLYPLVPRAELEVECRHRVEAMLRKDEYISAGLVDADEAAEC